jgi:hypothetical protein
MSAAGGAAFPQLPSVSAGLPLSRIAAGWSDLMQFNENRHAQD